MCSLLKAWKKQVRSSTLGRLLRIYWKVFFNEERRHLGHRCERLCLLKRLIKKITKTYYTIESVVLWSGKKRNF